ncbi:MAG: AraC family transcriptional regulator, partial [Pseudomonadota bacterium]
HVEIEGGVAVELGPGDLVLIPRGRAHILADQVGREVMSLESVLHVSGYDGRGVLALGGGDADASTQMICGHFTFREGADHPILRALPDHIPVNQAVRVKEPWLDDTLRLVARRIFSETVGSATAVTRLSEIVFIELLRIGIDRSPNLKTILDALKDKQIGRALELIHEAPEKPWSLSSLAREVGMSRSRFAQRFTAHLGTAPMPYLTDWRLQKSLALLDDPRCTIQEVAARSGYRLPAAYSRAFTVRFGMPPRDYRRQAA